MESANSSMYVNRLDESTFCYGNVDEASIVVDPNIVFDQDKTIAQQPVKAKDLLQSPMSKTFRDRSRTDSFLNKRPTSFEFLRTLNFENSVKNFKKDPPIADVSIVSS